LVVDTVNAYFYAVLTEPSGGGTPTITYISLTTGAIATPTGAVRPVEVTNIVLAAGTNLIGTVGIDQTTPGTTNGVVVNASALPTGAATSALQTTGNTSLSTLAGTVSAGAVAVSAAALPLPTGGATSALQTTGNTSLSTLAGTVSAGAVAVSAAALPLPTGAATSALQTTGNTSLASIATAVAAATPAGTAIIGKVGIDQTTPGTTNGVVVNAALPAGTNSIGTVVNTVADTAPATGTVTTQDLATTSSSGQNGQSIYTGAPTAGSTVAFALSSIATVRLQISGTWTGSIQPEISNDGGTTWALCSAQLPSSYQQMYFPVAFTQNVVGAIFGVAGATNFRMRATSAITGTATIKIIESINESAAYVFGAVTINETPNTSTDKSGTVTTGGTAQVFASNAARKGWQLSNLSNDILYVRDDGTAATAATGTPVYPGQTVNDGGRVTTSAISVLGATTGDVFSAKEYT
jgi:hypothetical protein